MRAIVIVALAAAACTPRPGPAPADPVPVAEASPDPLRACDGSTANALLGKLVDQTLRVEAMRLVGARTSRVIAPGMMVTMDYRGNRLNIDTDAANHATRFHCG